MAVAVIVVVLVIACKAVLVYCSIDKAVVSLLLRYGGDRVVPRDVVVMLLSWLFLLSASSPSC